MNSKKKLDPHFVDQLVAKLGNARLTPKMTAFVQDKMNMAHQEQTKPEEERVKSSKSKSKPHSASTSSLPSSSTTSPSMDSETRTPTPKVDPTPKEIVADFVEQLRAKRNLPRPTPRETYLKKRMDLARERFRRGEKEVILEGEGSNPLAEGDVNSNMAPVKVNPPKHPDSNLEEEGTYQEDLVEGLKSEAGDRGADEVNEESSQLEKRQVGELIVCPYDRNHTNPNKIHLRHCRVLYQARLRRLGKPMDIGICSYNDKHHLPLSELVEHEMACVKRNT